MRLFSLRDMLSKKGYILLSVMLSLVIPGLSQHLSLFDIDSESYPSINAKFYAFDENGIQNTTLTRSDVVIEENRSPQKVIKVTNPEYPHPTSLSIVLTVDISGSMAGRNMTIAKQATSTLVRIIQLDQSECAVTSFDQSNYINSDFSNDLDRLSNAIDKLRAQGGTNYDQAFNDKLTGALKIANSGAHKKVIIFLTDGLGTADDKQIIERAKRLGITIYCVTINMYAPQVLKEIATGTGGAYYENINTAKQAKKAYQKILIEIQELEPSTVEWISTPDCESLKFISFKAPSLKLMDNLSSYRINEKSSIKLMVSSSNIKFRKIMPDDVNDTTITLKALNADFTILSVSSSNPVFKIVNTNFPLKISDGQPMPITLQYKSANRKYEDAKISLINDLCAPTIIHVNNGLNMQEEVPLKVEHPNGGEVFFAGSDTVINWSGVFPWDEVKLEFSSDNGRSWKTLTSDAKSLQNKWHVPNIIGEKMLIKSSMNSGTKKSDLEFLFKRRERYNGFIYTMSPDNSKLIAQCRLSTYVLDFMTGAPLDAGDFRKYIGNQTIQPGLTPDFFSGDGSKIYTYRYGEPVQVYSALDYTFMGQFPKLEERYFFNDAATQYMRQIDYEVEIVDFETGKILKQITIPKGAEKFLFANSFRDNLVVVSRPRLKTSEVWNIDTKTKIASFTTDLKYMKTGTITENKKFLITTSSSPTDGHYPHHGKFTVFDLETKKELYSWTNPDVKKAVLDIAGDIMLRTINDVHQVVDIATGEVIAVVPHPGRAGSLSRDGKFVLINARSNQKDMKMFRFDPNSYAGGNGTDTSDNTFSIIAPKLVGRSVEFGTVRLGDSEEQIFSAFLSNSQNVDVAVDSIYLEGGDHKAFSIVSNRSDFKIKALSSGNIELRFKPVRIGINETNIIIQTPFEKISVSVKGEGVERRISLIDQTINMGKIKVGNEKDSLVIAVIKNTSSSTVSISSIEIAGPDRDQFELVSNKRFKLKKNSSRDLRIIFKPTLGGKTSTRVRYETEGEIGVHELGVFAEGIATGEIIPESITLTSDSVSDIHPDSLRVFRASVFDAQTKKLIASTLTRPESVLQNDNGKFEFYTAFDNQIKMLAQSDGYLPEAFTLESDPDRKYEEVNYEFLLTRIIAGETVQLDNVLFVRSKPVLLHESHEQLDMLYIYMTSHPENKIELSGHTDNQGSAKLNHQLSEDRVKTIRNYLINKGVNKKRISGKGYGQTKPIASNAREETRRLNRRVEFKVVE